MINKKTLLVFVSSFLLLILFSGFVSAGCCIYTDLGSGCQERNTIEECTTEPQSFVPDSCADRSECALGCCCDINDQGIGSTNASCQAQVQHTFISNPDVILGDFCSCVSGAYSISGTITRMTGGVIPGASVNAGGRSATTSNDGTYTLTDVPAGTAVLVSAFKQGCLPNSMTINLDSEKSGVDIQLECECSPGECDAEENAYCTSQSEWKVYDLITELSTYCAYCASYDVDDCEAPNECVSNNEYCPITCSPNVDDPDYDSDCVCSMTSNNACPAWCDETNDADCAPFAAECGDRLVTYPYETCEDDPLQGQLSLCLAEDCANPGETGECNCLSLSACGNFILEPNEDCELGMVCPDGSLCDNCECGSPGCVGDALNPTATASFDTDNNLILVSWAPDNECVPISYSLYRCGKETDNACSSTDEFLFLQSTSSLNFSDSNIAFASEYCYYVQAFYMSGDTGESSIVCEKTGDAYCLDMHPDEFCYENARSKCDVDNTIDMFEPCEEKFCMGPDRNGETWCSEIKVCDMCNGLYSMFSNIDLTVMVDEAGYLVSKYCHPGPFRDLVKGCYLDRTKTLFSAFDYCSDIISCYDYKSEAACADPDDPCDKNQGCEWVWLDNSYHELGGVCRPVAPEIQKCELCDDKKYNWLSPGCTPAVCSLFGEECFYQGSLSSYSCTKKSTLSCFDYANQQDCTGGTPVSIDAVYDANNIRIGGTHDLVTPSNDKFALGKCYWVTMDSTGRCYRNADNLPVDFAANTGFDCAIGDFACESDFSNPETIILQTCSGLGPCPADVAIRFSVNDDASAGGSIKTYFCMVPLTQATPCYPTELAADNLYEKKVDVSGGYTLYYYSEDFAKNLEPVKSINILVDAEPPTIEIVSPTEQNFPTALSSVDIKGIASLDTKYICVYEADSSSKNCINNCVYGQDPPCIDQATGEFNISVGVPSNGPHDILFDAEDFAGNQVVGWSLLSIYRNDTAPSEPLIIIEKSS